MSEKKNDFDLQAPWVGTLLDVANMRVAFENHAQTEGKDFYGVDKIDDLQHSEKNTEALVHIFSGYTDKPESWARLMNYLTAKVITSSPEDLKDNLIRLSAVGVAWLEDIDRRSMNGAKAGK
jgi:hypothetical protein